MKTKHVLQLSLSLFMLMPATIFAQNMKDRVETMHIAYLSQKLNLTSAEAEKFWPIYNEYKAAEEKLRKERVDNVQSVKRAGGVDSMSDADVQKVIATETDIETRELELRKEYVVKFQQALSLRKVAKFFIAEDGFKRFLLNQLRNHGHGGRGMDDNEGPEQN